MWGVYVIYAMLADASLNPITHKVFAQNQHDHTLSEPKQVYSHCLSVALGFAKIWTGAYCKKDVGLEQKKKQ